MSNDMEVILRLLVACEAAEDRLTELVPDPNREPVIDLVRAAMAETERALPPAGKGRKPHTPRITGDYQLHTARTECL